MFIFSNFPFPPVDHHIQAVVGPGMPIHGSCGLLFLCCSPWHTIKLIRSVLQVGCLLHSNIQRCLAHVWNIYIYIYIYVCIYIYCFKTQNVFIYVYIIIPDILCCLSIYAFMCLIPKTRPQQAWCSCTMVTQDKISMVQLQYRH